jgi:hypothetical protein
MPLILNTARQTGSDDVVGALLTVLVGKNGASSG